MGAGHVQVAPDSTGKDVDADSVTSTEGGTPTVYRQNVVIADPTTYANKMAVTAANAAKVDGSAVTQPAGGDTAAGAADAGNPIKVGGKVTLNNAALPTALTVSQRSNAMTDEYGRLRIVTNRSKILGVYFFESGVLSVGASADASTAGRFWLINPIGSTVLIYVKKLLMTATPTAATVFTTAPRITTERMTFTGTASGAQITPGKRATSDATATGTVRTAATGMTLTAGAIMGDYTIPAVITAVGIVVPYDQHFFEARDDDDLIVLAAGEGLIVRQPDAGSTSDTRKYVISGAWEER